MKIKNGGIQRIKLFFVNHYEYILIPLGLLIFFEIWNIIAEFYEPFILPSPKEVGLRFLDFWKSGLLIGHFYITLAEAFLGFGIGTIIALPLSYFLAHHPVLEKLFTPYIVGVQAIPIVALAPLLVIWFGFGLTSKILIAALVAFFPVLTNGVVGFRSTNSRLRELMEIMGAKRSQIFLKLELPSALPILFGGLKLGVTLSVIGAVVGEFSGAGKGLGYLVNSARGSFDTPLIFVALLCLAVLGVSFYLIVSFLEFFMMPWKRHRDQK